MKELLESCILSIYTDDENQWLVFITGYNSRYVYGVSGGCCSTTWFESITNPENIIDSTIIGIEVKTFTNRYMENATENSGYDDVKVYGYTLKSSKGYSDIEFRNGSNGYYGGDCGLIENTELFDLNGNSLKNIQRPLYLINEGVPLNLKYSDREDMVLIKPYKAKH